ncbi:MAG: arsenate reductase ArsC [Fibrobacterota bacterium]
MERKLKILFLCTGNSYRSQMAEGWTRHLKSDRIDACSAGIETHGLNPNAVTVMAEEGVDISLQKSQHIDEFRNEHIDYVITVCDHDRENCPFSPEEAKQFMWGFRPHRKWSRSSPKRGIQRRTAQLLPKCSR